MCPRSAGNLDSRSFGTTLAHENSAEWCIRSKGSKGILGLWSRRSPWTSLTAVSGTRSSPPMPIVASPMEVGGETFSRAHFPRRLAPLQKRWSPAKSEKGEETRSDGALMSRVGTAACTSLTALQAVNKQADPARKRSNSTLTGRPYLHLRLRPHRGFSTLKPGSRSTRALSEFSGT